MKFYTNTYCRGDTVFIRGYDNGIRFTDRIKYQPVLYLDSRKNSEYKTIYGDSVEPISPGSIRDTRDFFKRYEDVDNFTIHGSNLYAYTCLNENYGKDYDLDHIRIANIDIEVGSEQGFPEPDLANQPITAITIKVKNRLYVFGIEEYKNTRDDVRYVNCQREDVLIHKFLDLWEKLDVDIVTGWNVQFFDIPYLYNRISKLFDEKMANRLSPLKTVNERVTTILNRQQRAFELCGTCILDYLEMYKKFTPTNQESYRLDHIAHVEVGEKKLDYSEFANLHQLYKEDYQKFIDYNIKDVELVERIDDKMKLIEMALAIAYDAKVNYTDVFTQVRMWDVLIHNYLLEKKIVIPPKTHRHKDTQYAGAYVKDPQVGMHEWVMSFDLNSLYPHLIMQYNVSPETFVEGDMQNVTVDMLLDGKTEYTIPDDMVLAANGHFFRKDKLGFLPEMMQNMYDERVIYKKKMIEAEKKLEVSTENRYDIEKDISKYKNLQLAKKVQLNSAYGALGNQWFRFFDVRQAEAITLSGQLSIRWIERKLNEYINKILDTEKIDYILASDTDSVYIAFDALVQKVYKDKHFSSESERKRRIVDFLDKSAREIFEPFIDKSYKKLAENMNAYGQKMFMKREAIANKAIWTAKKRYMMNVFDNEGVRYTEPKLKMMGIEAVKSSTPSSCRDSIKKAITLILNSDETSVQKYIAEFKEKFFDMPFEDVAFPRTLSDLDKYDSHNENSLVIPKGTPIHVRGGLLYNHLIRKYELEKKYPLIQNGEKIKFCYLKEPNPTGQNILSIINNLPTEFDVEKYIDYETQFNKTYVEPLKIILDVIGWSVEKRYTLEDFWS